MLAASINTTWGYAFATALGLVLFALAEVAARFVRSRDRRIKDDSTDLSDIARFLWGRPKGPRTGMPAETGWTTKTDTTLTAHGELLKTLTKKVTVMGDTVAEILREILPDGNGGHNMRGDITRAAEAATKASKLAQAEATAQSLERDRVHALPPSSGGV